MTKQLKKIEIPFGTKDSELCGWEYTIPEGMEATIVDNKIVVKKKDSEDERIRKCLHKLLCSEITYETFIKYGLTVDSALDWLEKQGEQKPTNVCEGCNNVKACVACVDGSECAHIEESEPAWSEEDEINYNYALAACKYYGEAKGYADTETHQKTKNWLKSIKYRYFWKPSDEQIKVLSKYAEQNNYDGSVLTSLYQELKKLREK